MGRSSILFVTLLFFMALTVFALAAPRIADCDPLALVRRRQEYHKYAMTVNLSDRFEYQPALRQHQLYKNPNFTELDTCPCSNDGPVYSVVSEGINHDSAVSRLCRPKVTCTYDRDRHPPVIYQVTCGVATIESDPYTCVNRTFPLIYVLRRRYCTDSKGRDSEHWDWVHEHIHSGCELISYCNWSKITWQLIEIWRLDRLRE